MEYQQRHYSTAGWEFSRNSSSAPSIGNMLTSIRRASEAGPSFDHPQWRPMWDSSRPPVPHGVDAERPAGPVSPSDSKDQRSSQRLPSLASILNSPPPVSRPLRASIAIHGDHPSAVPPPPPPPRSSSPQFFRDEFNSAHHLDPARTDSVTAMTQGPPPPGHHPMPHHYADGYVQKPSSLHPPPHPPPPQAAPRRLSTTPGSIPIPLSHSDKLGSATPRGSPDELGEIPKNSLKRRAESIRGPPRMTKCIGQKEIPGEGLCWLYEDGSYCRTVIDGERVNPNWGVTKAGRPRKRLAQACLTCREKKIKCEPAYPKCHQCAKSQRICKGGMSQYMGTEVQTNSENTPHSSSNAGGSPVERSSVPSIHEQLPAAELTDSPKSAKRARTYSLSSGRGYFDYPCSSNNAAITPNSEAIDPSEREGVPFSLGWERDPYEADPKHTVQLLDLYFTHIASATYCMFPQNKFMHWVQNCNTKSQDDRMLLYSVLAMGSTFAMDHMLRALGKHLAEIASHALERRVGKFSLQLCQSRLMVSLYHWAQGKAGETIAWDMSASAFRAISALSLNTEKGIANLDDDDLTYGFDRPTLEECRRRTFWSGFLMDRYNGFCGGTMCVFNHDDIFLRLPCKESEYDRVDGVEPRPYFDYDSLLAPGPVALPVTGAMAHLVLISAIWGDVFSTTARAVHRTDSPTYATTYSEFHKQATRRLETWLTNLPPQLRYSTENLDTSIAAGYAGTFISLHALYHTTHIRLNRHIRPSLLPSDAVVTNIQSARRHAQAFLSIMQDLSKSSRSSRLSVMTGSPANLAQAFTFSTPFPGYAFLTAVDVLSVGGLLSDLPSLISLVTVGLSCVEELADFWASGKSQSKAVRGRLKLLGDVATGDKPEAVVISPPSAENEKAWKLKSGLETAIDHEDDAVYGAGSTEAFWNGILKEEDTQVS